MFRFPWHRAENRMSDLNYLALPLEASGVLARLEDLMGDGRSLQGNLSTLALYLGVDQKKYRLKTHLHTLINGGYINGTSEAINAKEIRFTLSLPPDHPTMLAEHEKKAGRKQEEKEQKGSRKVAETGVNKSAINAGSGDSALNKNKNLPTVGEEEIELPPLAPLPPRDSSEGLEGTEAERRLGEFETYFTRQLGVIHLKQADYRHMRDLVKRNVPFALVSEVVQDVKRAFVPSYEGETIRSVGLFMAEINARLSASQRIGPAGAVAVRAAPEPIQIIALREQVARRFANAGQFPDYPSALQAMNAWTVEQLEQERQSWTR